MIASVLATVGGKAGTQVMRRKIAPKDVQKAFAVFGMGLIAMFLLVVALMVVENADFLDSMYEMVSATATVGLSRNFTSSLSAAGKGIVILGMYLGRIGPITMALAINTRHDNSKTSYPTGRVLVG